MKRLDRDCPWGHVHVHLCLACPSCSTAVLQKSKVNCRPNGVQTGVSNSRGDAQQRHPPGTSQMGGDAR